MDHSHFNLANSHNCTHQPLHTSRHTFSQKKHYLLVTISLHIPSRTQTMVVQHMCGACNRIVSSPTLSIMHCPCGHHHPMHFLCSNCGNDYVQKDEFITHIGSCNRCPFCRLGGLNFTQLIQHIFPSLFPNTNLRPNHEQIGPCWTLHERNPF